MPEASSSRVFQSRQPDKRASGDERQQSSRSGQKASGRQPGADDDYQEPQDWSDLDEERFSPPVHGKKPSPFENVKYRSGDFQAFGSRERPSGDGDGYDLSELAAGPPVQSSNVADADPPAAEQQPLTDGAEEDDADSEGSTAPPPFVARRPEDYIHQRRAPKPVPRLLTQLYTVSYLIFFSMLGTLARLGVQWLTFYPGAPLVTPVIWANFAGSVFMGFLSEDQGLFKNAVAEVAATSEERTKAQADNKSLSKADHAKHKKTIPLFIGLATGFCGSFTSFSSFARDIFLALSNDLPTPVSHANALNAGSPSTSDTVARNGGYSFEALVAVIISTVALALGGLILGAHLAISLAHIMPHISTRLTRRFLDPLAILLGWGCWLGAIFLVIWPPDRPSGSSSHGSWANETWRGQVLFALVFAPVGCLLRFYASVKLNGLVSSFPLGTFAVNMLGTAVEGMCYDIQHVGVGIMGRTGGGRVGCQVLQGVQDGFCGCLTTVSTWAVEINGLRRRHAYVYALTSVVSALCLMVVIMGSVRWTVGFATPACNTGYPDKIHG